MSTPVQIKYNGQMYDYAQVCAAMNWDLRMYLSENWYSDPQEFFDTYKWAHYEKFGEYFVIN